MRKTYLMIAILVWMTMIPEFVLSGILPVPKSHKKMVIITSEELSPAADSFKLWHNALGETTYVYFASSIYNSSIGWDRQDKIRSFIKYLNEVKGINAVLFLGDTSVIPIRFAKYTGIYNDALIPTDLYYADLDGNWDANGNGIFGEYVNGINVDDIDGYPDVVIGRIPINNNEGLIDYLHMMISYETSMPVLSVHFWGASINDISDGIGQSYSLAMKDNLPNFISSKLLFNPLIDTFTVNPRWVGDEELNRVNAINDLNNESYLTIHIDNGEYDWLGTGFIVNGEQLNAYCMRNIKTKILISSSSYGAISHKGSVGYAFLSNGGLAYISNTSIGYPVEALNFSKLLRNIFSDSSTYISDAFDRIYGNSIYFDYTLNYLGDPLLRNYPHMPAIFHYDIKYSSSSIYIKLNEPDAFVTLISGDSITFTGFTDSEGNIHIPYCRNLNAKITISKKGFVTSVVNINSYNGISDRLNTNNMNNTKINIKNAKVYGINGRYLGKYSALKTSLASDIYIISDGRVTSKISLIK